ncbi:MAG: hypothetical protein H8E12_15345 [Rhodobacteraceae bacterium]|nr:hypothetical protein [Paracoccaceae bacterium]
MLEEVSEEPLLAIENRELNSAISEQPTEELLTTRSNPNPRELPPKRYLLQDETPVFT